MLDQIRFFAGAARVLEGRAAGEYMKGHTSWIRREPIGVVGQVTPWNYPMMMAVWKIAPALAAGNTVVLKPSDTTPETTLLLAEIASEFLPAGTFNVVTGDRDTGRALVEHPTPALVAITGSVRAGMQVAESAAQHASSACTSNSAARHRSSSSTTPTSRRPSRASRSPGTSTPARTARPRPACSSARQRLRRLRGGARGLQRRTAPRSGQPDDEDALFGPVNNANQLARVTGFLDRAPQPRHGRGRRQPHHRPGRRLLPRAHRRGGTPPGRRGMIQNEIFGPVITVQRFTDEDEACRLGQRRRLRPGVVGLDQGLRSAMRMSKRLDFGCVWINTHIPLVAEMPHGGFKRSGYGKDLSMYGFEDYTRIKHVMANIES
jgi:betaine-aldehyde dehydrogenase